MTYLELVNDVLIRLREGEVSSVSDNSYSKLIGAFVNDAKRTVEDAYNWNALTDTLTAVTTEDIFNYVLVGSSTRFRVLNVLNDTSNEVMGYKTGLEMDELFLIPDSVQKGSPLWYNFNGVNSNGDTQVDIYPKPDGVYNIRFNMIVPQSRLTSDTTALKVPDEPVILLAYAKALAERGEDGGLASSEAYALYKQSLTDYISIEAGHCQEEYMWYSA
jgi:asparagine N-glycosylation enzyme membrane subunit Stt3